MKTYYDLALEDLSQAEENWQNKKRFNKISIDCQQASEKFLKQVILTKALTRELLTSHNLADLVKELRDTQDLKYDWNKLIDNARYLKAFYYDARYPGDNYVDVEDWQAEKCLAITHEIKHISDALLDSSESGNSKMRLFEQES